MKGCIFPNPLAWPHSAGGFRFQGRNRLYQQSENESISYPVKPTWFFHNDLFPSEANLNQLSLGFLDLLCHSRIVLLVWLLCLPFRRLAWPKDQRGCVAPWRGSLGCALVSGPVGAGRIVIPGSFWTSFAVTIGLNTSFGEGDEWRRWFILYARLGISFLRLIRWLWGFETCNVLLSLWVALIRCPIDNSLVSPLIISGLYENFGAFFKLHFF